MCSFVIELPPPLPTGNHWSGLCPYRLVGISVLKWNINRVTQYVLFFGGEGIRESACFVLVILRHFILRINTLCECQHLYCWMVFQCMVIPQLNYSLVDGNLSCFQFLAITNKTMNIHVQELEWTYAFVFLGKILGVKRLNAE